MKWSFRQICTCSSLRLETEHNISVRLLKQKNKQCTEFMFLFAFASFLFKHVLEKLLFRSLGYYQILHTCCFCVLIDLSGNQYFLSEKC